MPILSGPSLSCIVAQQKEQKPPNRPEHWRKGQGRFRGCGAPLDKTKKTIIVIVPRHCAGSQTPQSPHSPLSRRVSPTTPSRRRVRWHAPRQGTVGAGGGCGSDDQVALDARQRRCKMQETAEIPNPTTPNQETRGGENAARGTPPTQKKEESATRPRKDTETTQQPDKDQDQGQKKHPPRPPTPTRQEMRKHRTGNERRRRKKKKNRCGSDALGNVRRKMYGSRAESVSRMQKHKGNPKPKRFGVSQRLRERGKRKKRRRRNEPDRRRRRTQTNTEHGSGREGLKGTRTKKPTPEK